MPATGTSLLWASGPLETTVSCARRCDSSPIQRGQHGRSKNCTACLRVAEVEERGLKPRCRACFTIFKKRDAGAIRKEDATVAEGERGSDHFPISPLYCPRPLVRFCGCCSACSAAVIFSALARTIMAPRAVLMNARGRDFTEERMPLRIPESSSGVRARV